MTATASRPAATIFRRPAATTGFWSWITTVDHKKIGIMYGYTAFVFFLIGGIEALLLRIQLSQPNNDFLTAAEYNALFTTHAVTMIFLFVMPAAAAFMNYLLPLMVGARDVAFPRMNALSFWIFLMGGLFLYSVIFFADPQAPLGIEDSTGAIVPGNLNEEDNTLLGGLPDAGWFMYQPNAGPDYSPGLAIDFASLGLQILGVASLISSVNFIVTIFNMRAKGMRLLRMPVFVWMTMVVAFLLLFSLPIIAVACSCSPSTASSAPSSSSPATGGDPVLWQHLFWLFGHPEVYILILPAMGIVSEVLPVFSASRCSGTPRSSSPAPPSPSSGSACGPTTCSARASPRSPRRPSVWRRCSSPSRPASRSSTGCSRCGAARYGSPPRCCSRSASCRCSPSAGCRA
jgi:cytochrome c oxidase subunit I